MLLAVDIGNTNISFGIFSGPRLVRQFDIPTKKYTRASLARSLRHFRIRESLVCSVVPQATRSLKRDLASLTGLRPYIIGKDLVVPIQNCYRVPSQVGQDRLVNAYAAASLYGYPLVVIDSGTAITFDVISGKAQYLGGLIFPGMRISLEALAEKTALLPQVELSRQANLIGTDTSDSIISGVILGTAALCKELAAKIVKSLGKNAAVVGTGGNILMIKKYSGMRMKINPNLTLIGIRLVYENVKGALLKKNP